MEPERDEKQFCEVDKSPENAAVETKPKRSLIKSVLLSIFGIIAGAIVFFIVLRVATWLVAFLGEIPILGKVIYYPSDGPWALLALPGPLAALAGAAVCAVICGRSAPFCVTLIAVYLLCAIFLLCNHALPLRTGIAAVFTIGAAVVTCGMSDDDVVK